MQSFASHARRGCDFFCFSPSVGLTVFHFCDPSRARVPVSNRRSRSRCVAKCKTLTPTLGAAAIFFCFSPSVGLTVLHFTTPLQREWCFFQGGEFSHVFFFLKTALSLERSCKHQNFASRRGRGAQKNLRRALGGKQSFDFCNTSRARVPFLQGGASRHLEAIFFSSSSSSSISAFVLASSSSSSSCANSSSSSST